ncbi:MAG: GAK system CofD-like protein [Pseudodesulfovibrio sp.]|nr:GAK system CofD-like protein [Pseudodesulfovibrio sp.]
MTPIRSRRENDILDSVTLERYRRSPEQGPAILFFSGGTALRDVSRILVEYTHNSIHIITPFDSGGSSAIIRNGFDMLAVGDIRNRLMALVDLSVVGNRELYALFTCRLSKRDTREELVKELERMAEGEHFLVKMVPEPMRAIICEYFVQFLNVMSDDFDLRGASIGNIMLAAGYLANRTRFESVLSTFSELAQVRGVVRPVLDKSLHLAAELADGSVVVGQHLLTGKEASPLTSRIEKVWLTDSLDAREPVTTCIADNLKERIAGADLVCYPVGSFYSSVVANLLPQGVGEAVAANGCPKVFIPNPAHDPELLGHSVADQVACLQEYLMASGAPDAQSALQIVLVDSQSGEYPGGFDRGAVEMLGVEVVDCSLMTESSSPYFDGERLVHALLSLI